MDISLGVGHHSLGKKHGFGLRKEEQGRVRKHGSLKKQLGVLVHQGLEERQEKAWIFEITKIWDLVFKKQHHIALRKDGLLTIGGFRYFRLTDRQHRNRLNRRQDVCGRTV